MSSLHTAYQSQSTNTPPSIIQALVMSQQGSRAASPSPPEPNRNYGPIGKPRFTCADESAPGRGELVAYFNQLETYLQTIMAVLHFIGVPNNTWPDPIDFSVETAVRNVGTIYKMLADMERRISIWEFFLAKAKLKQSRDLTDTMSRAATTQPQGYGGGSNKLKVPKPAPYTGKKGDPAFTFIAACNNYRVMDPNAFSSDEVFIRWSLQQMSDGAGQWAVMQMMRLDSELDNQGRPPKELRKWKNFCEHFVNQFGDPGLMEKAKN